MALTPSVPATGALLVVPGAVVSHHTAPQVLGGVVPDPGHTHVTVTRPQDRRRRPDLRCHVQPDVQPWRVDGIPLTAPEPTFVDLAGHLSLVDLVVLGDSSVHRRVTTADRLLDAAGAASGPGAALARRGAALVRPRAESPMETRSRLLLTFGGLSEPRVNEWVEDEQGRPRYRLDLPYPSCVSPSSTTAASTPTTRPSGDGTSRGGSGSRGGGGGWSSCGPRTSTAHRGHGPPCSRGDGAAGLSRSSSRAVRPGSSPGTSPAARGRSRGRDTTARADLTGSPEPWGSARSGVSPA